MQINPARFVTVPGIGKVSVGKVLCIGRNYAKHAAEMKAEVPSTPMVFLKPATALEPDGGEVVLPPGIGSVHHEVELVALIGRRVSKEDRASASSAIAGYAVGLDMTARDVQAAAKKSGGPWSIAKGYDTFAPVGAFAASPILPGDAAIRLRINGRLVQEGEISDMIFDVSTLVAYCSTIFTLEPGDLLYTGTPEGVGPVQIGDVLEASVDGLPPLTVRVAAG